MSFDTLNFRDLGGMPANAGYIRSGRLLRSEGPANFSPEQFAALRELGIRNIVDLRTMSETEQEPHLWQGDACQWNRMEVKVDLRFHGNDGRHRLLEGGDAQTAMEVMVETYSQLPDALAPHWRAIGACLREDGCPLLINCTAGKDRTGVAVALILEMAGVPRETIMEDYLQSRVFGDSIRRSGKLEEVLTASFGFMPPAPQIDALIGAHSDYLNAAWEAIDRRWAGVSSYLAEAGLAEAQQQGIRDVLVVGTSDIADTSG